MVTGADKDRLDVLLGVVYAVVGLATLVPGIVSGRGFSDDEVDAAPARARPPGPSRTRGRDGREPPLLSRSPGRS